MIVTSEIEELRRKVREARQSGQRIGCVPTMGALHAGHLSLVAECRKHVDFVLLTIFVNPTQFAAGEDLDKYPRPLEQDLSACEAAGVDVAYTPNVNDLYRPGFETWVEVEELQTLLEGAHRPRHFRGVTTIVAKLFNITQPDVACFGQKDYQQQLILRTMVSDLNFPIEIVTCPTIREADGLAMSSRNQYLSPTERQQALSLSQALTAAQNELQQGARSIEDVEQLMHSILTQHPNVRPDYAVIRNASTLQPLEAGAVQDLPEQVVALVAAKVGKTRLIDNRTIDLQTSGSAT